MQVADLVQPQWAFLQHDESVFQGGDVVMDFSNVRDGVLHGFGGFEQEQVRKLRLSPLDPAGQYRFTAQEKGG
jgi:hypothetical protein